MICSMAPSRCHFSQKALYSEKELFFQNLSFFRQAYSTTVEGELGVACF